MRACNKKRFCNFENESNNNRKRSKNDNSDIKQQEEKKSDNMNNIAMDYDAETTVELANRLRVPVYAHKIVFHKAEWMKFMNNKYDLTKIDINAVEPIIAKMHLY